MYSLSCSPTYHPSPYSSVHAVNLASSVYSQQSSELRLQPYAVKQNYCLFDPDLQLDPVC